VYLQLVAHICGEMELNGEDKVNRICVDALEVMKKWSSRLIVEN
jgi:hypothetical protein